MNDSIYTIAEATVADNAEGSHERTQLVVYFDADVADSSGDGSRTRIVEVPDGSEVTFGRSRATTVQIDSEKVSRTHARIARRGTTITVEDLDSRNGTRVNGNRIHGATLVRSGDQIDLGPATVVVNVTTRVSRATPVGSTSYLEERLAAEADRGVRYRRPFGLVMLRLEGDHVATDAAVGRIAAKLRAMDVIAEYGPDELAIIFPEVQRAAAEQAAEHIAGDARAAGGEVGRLSVRVGLAAFPDHGTQPGELLSRARDALTQARRGNAQDVVSPPARKAPDNVIIGDPQMERVYQLVQRVAATPMTVLINGETGVGKEVVAEALHKASSRAEEPYIRLNCASIPETLLESALFGHEKGAFTGADSQKSGYFEAANQGTLFLDEIGEISPALQAKLLRVLEEGKFMRVGGTKEIEVDVRVVCATNRDLEAEVSAGSFREDLFFRISAFTIVVPPLRDRPGEIVPLAEHFCRKSAADLNVQTPTLSAAAMATLRSYSWPGNVRELRNAVERAVVLQQTGVVDNEHLPERVVEGRASLGASVAVNHRDMAQQVADVERLAIVKAMEETGQNQTKAAKALGISRRALIYKLEKYGLKARPASARP